MAVGGGWAPCIVFCLPAPTTLVTYVTCCCDSRLYCVRRTVQLQTVGWNSRTQQKLRPTLVVLVVQRFGVRLVIERSLVRLPAGAISSQLG